jgi:hypothetical protein
MGGWESGTRLRWGKSSTEGETHLQRWRLVYRGGYLSTKEETRLQRGRRVYGGSLLQKEGLVYGGGGGEDLSTEGETCLQSGDLSAKWESHLRKGELVYRGGDLSKRETRHGGGDSSRRGRLVTEGGGGLICMQR